MRVVPSSVISLIETRQDLYGNVPGLPRVPGSVKGLLALIDLIPDELIRVSPSDFAAFVGAREQLKVELDPPHFRPYTKTEIEALKVIYQVLRECPDDAPAPDTTDPAFISDEDLRSDLHQDLGEVNRSLHNGEWKGATVLAGSIIETLLLWALQNKTTEANLKAAATTLGKSVDLTARPLEQWYLRELIAFARADGLISESTHTAVILCQDFRNLIHPGRSRRLSLKCNRSTALIGVGGVEAVMRDLS
jgi:hypothetical protein